jgi:Pentapeptide repeats (8 copies)
MSPGTLDRLRAAERYKAWFGIAVVVSLLAFVIFVPKLSFLAPSGKLTPAERAKAESDLRGHLIQTIGGLALLVGGYYTARTFTLNREGQITERFTRAVEQLGDKKLDIRLGGIYALERIARDSKTHYEPVIEVLTAFLREHTPAPALSEPPSEAPTPRADVQAAATVIGRRGREYEREGYRVDLRRVDLRRVALQGADLENAMLLQVDLSGARLEGANLKGAELTGAKLNNAFFWSEAFPSAATLGGASLSVANLDGASLKCVDLREVRELYADQVAQALTDARTKFPPDWQAHHE